MHPAWATLAAAQGRVAQGAELAQHGAGTQAQPLGQGRQRQPVLQAGLRQLPQYRQCQGRLRGLVVAHGRGECGVSTTGMDLEVGVPTPSATESSGTSGLVSG